ncbi:MAG TPA: hypothetical protein VMV73_01870 [Candidatus Dormibacteraeota bacterium]|nr:hypothetical protein [Candidatus Dormibacteraeota bacterium]
MLRTHLIVVAALTAALSVGALGAQNQITPTPSPAPSATSASSASPTPLPTGAPAPSASPTPIPTPTPSPTPVPIGLTPAAALVAVGSSVQVAVANTLGTVTLTGIDPKVAAASYDSISENLTILGIAPGTTSVTITDMRGISATLAIRVAFSAGTLPSQRLLVRITGEPASPDFVRKRAFRAIESAIVLRPGAQLVLSRSDILVPGELGADDTLDLSVPVTLQGSAFIEVDGTVNVRVENIAAPRISPASLMVSDFPERLTADGVLFTANLHRSAPSRFLYFHYNPPHSIARRIVLRATNTSPEPALVEFIDGRGGPSPNEMEAGHISTKRFLVHLVTNEGRIVQIPGYGSLNLVEQDLPANAIVSDLLQLRVLNGGLIHLMLFAQRGDADPSTPPSDGHLLVGHHLHARGIYAIPEFSYATQWNVDDPYLQLAVGEIPLPNDLVGQALSGDYGVLQNFEINVINPTRVPQTIALYENPRGGGATGTYLIDNVLVQSHQVRAYTRYKLRSYVVPARGFLRLHVTTIPDAGSSFPVRLIVAPDDGSVAPGAPGSPVYVEAIR